MRVFTPERKKSLARKIGEFWSQLKDFMLVLFLLSTLISYLQQLHFKSDGELVPAESFVSSVEAKNETIVSGGEEESLPSVSQLADAMFTIESSRGKNVLCPDGQYNGYGYGQHKENWLCFDTQEEVDDLVIKWIEDKKEKGMSDEELLCFYNTGRTAPCPYSDKIFNIINYEQD